MFDDIRYISEDFVPPIKMVQKIYFFSNSFYLSHKSPASGIDSIPNTVRNILKYMLPIPVINNNKNWSLFYEQSRQLINYGVSGRWKDTIIHSHYQLYQQQLEVHYLLRISLGSGIRPYTHPQTPLWLHVGLRTDHGNKF